MVGMLYKIRKANLKLKSLALVIMLRPANKKASEANYQL